MGDPQMVRGIVERLKTISEEVITLGAEEEMLWKQFYGFIDDAVGADQPYRWTHPDLKMTIGRVMAENSPRLDVGRLEEILTDDEWRLCTKQVRIFDADRLTAEVAAGGIKKDDVQAATSQKPPTSRKHFRSASKDELKKLEQDKLS
jgi:hypothetical protein